MESLYSKLKVFGKKWIKDLSKWKRRWKKKVRLWKTVTRVWGCKTNQLQSGHFQSNTEVIDRELEKKHNPALLELREKELWDFEQCHKIILEEKYY